MPGELTEITELSTALGMLSPDLPAGLADRPPQLANVPQEVWDRLVAAHAAGGHDASFTTAFANGKAFLHAEEGLRGRRPLLVEWRGPHRPPGDEVIPADLRVDHVYLVSCKYLSKVLVNAGPPRLFERLLVGDERSATNWFSVTAPLELQKFYEAALVYAALPALSPAVGDLGRSEQRQLRSALGGRTLPPTLQPTWSALCAAVSAGSAGRWDAALSTPRARLRMFWRLLRVSNATYFMLGADRSQHLRLRVASNWDWMQAYELRGFEVAARDAGQPEVGWRGVVRRRVDGEEVTVNGHVEVRWSHGRFVGPPEAKVYLDTPHVEVPGYHLLS